MKNIYIFGINMSLISIIILRWRIYNLTQMKINIKRQSRIPLNEGKRITTPVTRASSQPVPPKGELNSNY